MPNEPIPTNTPARRALIEMLDAKLGPCMILDTARSVDEDDAAALAAWLDQYAPGLGGKSADAAVLRAASAEIHETLRARGLLVTSRGKLARIVDGDELERRYQIRREAGADPDARRDDGGA